MPTDLSTIDLATINVAHEVIVASIRSKVCQWEQESSDLATDGKLSNAVMVKNWAFSADILATTVSTARCQLRRRVASITLAGRSPQPPAMAGGWAALPLGFGWRIIDARSDR